MPTINYRNRYARRRRRALLRRPVILATATILLVCLIALIVASAVRRHQDAPVSAPVATPSPEIEDAPTVVPSPSPSASPDASAEMSTGQTVAQRAATRPSATAPGFLPVFRSANTEEKIAAITVDDCYQANNLKQIVDKAIELGAKLTIFPIGENVLLERQSEILKYAWENGFELENHTFTHNGLYNCSDEVLAEEIYGQQMALSQILNVEYQPHFLRPMGGDARHDQRIHKYIEQLGYYGVAHWSASGRASDASLGKALKPGAIFLFHTTDADLDKLLRFMPWVIAQGYQLVTLNEMFGYPANETSALTTSPTGRTPPPLQPYETAYVTLKKTTYSYLAYRVQEKLIALGYLKGEPDGVFGEGSEAAVKAYQRDHGLKATGEADAELLRALLEA